MTLAAMLAFLAAALAAGGLGELLGGLASARSAGVTARGRPGAARGIRLLARVVAGLRPPRARAPRDLEARIAAAGRPGGLGPRELMALKTAATAGGGLLGALAAGAAPGRLGYALLAGAPAGAFLLPDLWLARRANARARRIRRELPSLLDLLRVSVESGRSLPAALREVGSRSHGPLAAEWSAAGRQVALGIPLDAALAGMAARAPLAEVRALVAALDRARRHGAPLAETLAAQARDARFALARGAREDAARAGPKIQLVVALLLVPSVLLLVAAALLGALLDGGEGAPVPI